MAAEQAYVSRDPEAVAAVELGGIRTLLVVPMLKDQELVGTINIFRQEVRPFTDKQIELVRNFAAQAVIAIENTRLLNELRQRTDDLSEALEQQTATSEVLRVISASPGELEPVFEAMLANATRICQANFGNLYLRDGDDFRIAAAHNTPPAMVEARRRLPLRADSRMPISRVVKTGQVVHVVDFTAEQAYVSPIRKLSQRPSWAASGPYSSSRCSRSRRWSGPSTSSGRRCARSATSRSRW